MVWTTTALIMRMRMRIIICDHDGDDDDDDDDDDDGDGDVVRMPPAKRSALDSVDSKVDTKQPRRLRKQDTDKECKKSLYDNFKGYSKEDHQSSSSSSSKLS
eukprot:12415604-Karenia_brevis.AAC.1